ncbi:glycosyl transferase [Bacillus canaveralius]|uniref:Glycosyl transferase n=1 Tax=Bacillus canaveralius TaxID=1403243 RepID=A0A2N5GFV4_9BACI|nr:glycosyltransferase [Bacillus canaveralius]PLR79637.1 glycosyl transferase [Bacillus canaveralius]PLR92068.1 glycosyl transferase [Bacillus canaveralius]
MNDFEKIPRIIHFCWFGKGEKPKLVAKCIKSWKDHLKNYKFIEWNESNFDINSNPFVREAYEAKKFAFVSDYVRLFALYRYGGIYMDTDVEVIKSLDRFLVHDAFLGFEDDMYLQSGTMGAVKGHSIIGSFLNYYSNKSFIKPDGAYDLTTNTYIMTKICGEFNLINNGKLQTLINEVVIYPRTFFSPYDYINGGNYITDESYTIHHFAQSWLPTSTRVKSNVKRMVSRFVGPFFISTIRKVIKNK